MTSIIKAITGALQPDPVWEPVPSEWPHPEGFAVYSNVDRVSLGHGASKAQAQAICDELNSTDSS